MPAKKNILILGESPLVEEYSSLFHNRGFSIGIRPRAKTDRVPTGFRRVTRISRSFDAALELTNTDLEGKKANLVDLDRGLSPNTPIISSCVTITLDEQATWISNPGRLVGIGALPTLLENPLVEICSSLETDEKVLKGVKELVEKLGKEYAEVQGGMGLVVPRMICAIINEACFAMSERVAGSNDIDTAMKLGTNYPRGPIEWGEKIGPRQVLGVMEALQRSFGEERYRPSPFLRKAARKNSFFQPV